MVCELREMMDRWTNKLVSAVRELTDWWTDKPVSALTEVMDSGLTNWSVNLEK